MKQKTSGLQGIYDHFETAAAAFKANAACGKGCSFCCTDAGSIHVTTLEGLVIRDRISQLPRSRQVAIKKALANDRKRRERKKKAPCPLLMKNRACTIYQNRPFACRRIYSLKVCGPNQHPLLNRQVMAMGDDAIRRLQQLDDTGYSGHLSSILFMLDSPAFLHTYLDGAFQPEAVKDFGKAHGIVINRIMAQQSREGEGSTG